MEMNWKSFMFKAITLPLTNGVPIFPNFPNYTIDYLFIFSKFEEDKYAWSIT